MYTCLLHIEYTQNKYIQTHKRPPDPIERGALILPAPSVSPASLHGADTDIDSWITNPSPESIKSVCRIDLAEQQDSEIHRWISDSPWLSVILYCVLRNQRRRLTGDAADNNALFITDWLVWDIRLLCIRNREAEEDIFQTFKDLSLPALVLCCSSTYRSNFYFDWMSCFSVSAVKSDLECTVIAPHTLAPRIVIVRPQTIASAFIRGSDRFYSTLKILISMGRTQ